MSATWPENGMEQSTPPPADSAPKRNWLRSEFAYRFGLTRLIVAIMFFGTFLGLNLCGPQASLGGRTVVVSGWPLPVVWTERVTDAPDEPLTPDQFDRLQWAPWTHFAYHLVDCRPFFWLTEFSLTRQTTDGWSDIYVFPALIDSFFALVALAMILFLQPPRNKAPNRRSAGYSKACPKCGSTKTKPTFYAQSTMGTDEFAMIRSFFCESYFVCTECDCVFDDWGKIRGRGKWSWAYGLLACFIVALVFMTVVLLVLL